VLPGDAYLAVFAALLAKPGVPARRARSRRGAL